MRLTGIGKAAMAEMKEQVGDDVGRKRERK